MRLRPSAKAPHGRPTSTNRRGKFRACGRDCGGGLRVLGGALVFCTRSRQSQNGLIAFLREWVIVGCAKICGDDDNTRQAKSTQGRLRRSVGGCRPRAKPNQHAKHMAKQNTSFLKSDLESPREFGRLQGGPFPSHSERPTVGRPRGDPRCGSTQGRLPAVDLSAGIPDFSWLNAKNNPSTRHQKIAGFLPPKRENRCGGIVVVQQFHHRGGCLGPLGCLGAVVTGR